MSKKDETTTKKAIVGTDRSFEGMLSAVHSLMSVGLELEASAKMRPRIMEMMHDYCRRANVDLDSVSPRTVHVAGTKGKGSTVAFCESILRASGCKTGMFTSPHLMVVTERFRINGAPVEKQLLLRHFWETWDLLHNSEPSFPECPPIPSFFRFLTVVAFRLFQAEGVDALLLEVGMGGRLDPTNVVGPPACCGCSTLDLDHVHVLGNTLAEIAAEKAGVFKKGSRAFASPQRADAAEVLQRCAAAASCPLTVVPALPDKLEVAGEQGSRLVELPLGLQGAFQRTNAGLAVALARAFLLATGRAEPLGLVGGESCVEWSSGFVDVVQRGLESTRWPGRAQTVELPPAPGQPGATPVRLHLDGAHTLLSMDAAADWFHRAATSPAPPTPLSPRVLLFACSHERNPAQLFPPLLALRPQFAHVLLCPLDSARPSLLAPKTPRELLVEEGVDLAAADDAVRAADDVSGVAAADVQQELVWQHTERRVWSALDLMQRREEGRDDNGEGVHADVRVLPSVRSAVELIRSGALSPAGSSKSERMEVMVVGSLYLVGDVLRAVGWEEEPAPLVSSRAC